MRSEWTRATLTAVTVADQADYSFPSGFSATSGERILEVSVDGNDYGLGSAQQGRQLARGDVFLRGNGLYWISFDASGTEKLTLYPTPTESGLTISILCVREPTELVASTDVPAVPGRFRSAIADYAAAHAFGTIEDNAELRAYYEQQFDTKVAELMALRNSREGRGTAQMLVEGWHY